MPKLTDEFLEQGQLTNNYNYSFTPIDQLGASEYTLVTAAYDVSGSTAGFIDKMSKTVEYVINALRKSPRADNLMFRLVQFDTAVKEIHGFKLLSECHPSDYVGVLKTGGMTSLFDATMNSLEAKLSYAETLRNSDFLANGIMFLVTDGLDNASRYTTKAIEKKLKDVPALEVLESLLVILIGINVHDQNVTAALQNYQSQTGIDKYIELDNVSDQTLAKLAEFIASQSLSASQSLGSGGPSQILSF